MEYLPNGFISWIIWLLPSVIAIGVSFYYSFGQAVKKQQQEVIEIQAIKIDALEKEVKDLKEQQAINTAEITKFKSENILLTSIIQGRDKNTEQYVHQWPDIVKSIQDIKVDTKLLLQDSQRYAHMVDDIRTATNIIINEKNGRNNKPNRKQQKGLRNR